MYAVENVEPALRPWPATPRPAADAAVLITLSTRDRSPLLVVDPRAGDAVARRLCQLHGGGRRVLAWAVLPDRALALVTAAGGGSVARLVSDLVDRTTDDLARLGHAQVWRWPVEALPVRPEHDLAALLEYVLRAPERAGLADGWRHWRWAGSCHWPDPELAILTTPVVGLLWLDALTGNA